MSTDVSETVLDEVASRGETLTIHDLLRVIERYDTGPGVPEDQLDAYIDALGTAGFDAETVRNGLDKRLVEATEWQTETAVYRLDGELSAFPPRWHEDLTDERDITRYVATMTAAIDGDAEGYAYGGQGDGVPEKLLLDTVVVFGDYAYGEAMDEVDRLRDDDLLTADADQHPNARVQLTPAGAEQLGIDPED